MDTKVAEAKETFQILLEMSRLLNTGLDPVTLSICIRLCESGLNPQVLATLVTEIRKQAAMYKNKKKSPKTP